MNATPGLAPKDAADVAASIIGRTLSDDAVFLLRLAVYLGAARAKERNIPLVAYASWRNLMGAALLAPDPASRWLQAKRADFDLDELLPAPPARLTALRAASDGQAPVDALGTTSSGQTPDFFTSSVTAQLQAAAALAAPVHGAQGGNPPTPNSPTTVHALHIVGSMILQPVGDHGGDGAVGRGGEAQKSAIRTHMAEWMADNAAAIDPGQRGIVSSYLGDGGARYRIFLPELAAAVMPNEEAGSPIPTDFPAGALRASGPLGRVLARRRGAGAERYPREWTPFLDLLEEAAGPVWMNDLPGEGGPIAGLGLSLLARASALAAKVSREEPTSAITDLRHLVGAVLAPADAALPPAFEPFPAFRRDMPSSERQAIRRRFLHIIQQYPTASNRSERRTVWTDVILGERLVTARIPTDLRPIDDLLGFRRYANAFASVIADEHVSPPLAIGLFGPWGSGKSAMIDMIDAALQDIDARAAFDEEPRFCRGIVRVVFNAWHYAETNLWASLFVRILEAMAAHLRATPPPTPHDERDTSLRELEEAKEQQRIADAEVARVELEAARAAEDKAKADQDLTVARQAEADVTAAIAGKVRAAEAAQSTRLNALEVAGDAAALLFAFGRPTAADLAGATGQQLEVTLKKQLAAVSELTKSLQNLSDPLRRLELILGWKNPVLVRLLAAAAVAVPVAFFVVLAVRSGWLEALAGGALSAITVVSGALAGLGPLWARSRDAISRAPALINKLADAADNVQKRAEEEQAAEKKAAEAEAAPSRAEARAKTTEVMARARSAADEVAKAEKIVVTARARADSARQAVAAAESRIAERAPERLLSRFVEERAASEEYGRQLGLPTRIRRDLDSLRDYLKNLAGATHASRRADRVVLFIDDLDRCGPDIVVKVLEAVHILLSSNLFVVVVGVDVRWLTQSLATHHADQFRGNAALDPEEFLEKIFQVPFWIPAMSPGGSQAIVSDALPEVRRTGGDSPPLPGATQPGLAPGSAGGGATPGDAGRGNQSAEAAPLPTLEAVQLGEEEHKAVLRWGSLAGDTPRRLKRFARSYLILRASLTPAERDSFVGGSAFDTVARLLALNIADPKEWSSLTAHLTSNATSWPAQSLGAAWQRLFGPDTQPPAPADCRAWLPEVERFGFVLGGRSGSPAAA